MSVLRDAVAGGWMSAQLAPDADTGTGGHIGYGGRFQVDETAAVVHHEVMTRATLVWRRSPGSSPEEI